MKLELTCHLQMQTCTCTSDIQYDDVFHRCRMTMYSIVNASALATHLLLEIN